MSSAEPAAPPTPRAARAGRARGFTLLEVMCAIAILAFATGTITRLWFEAVERGSEAVDLRELREAADTVFRRLLYEDGRHPDGLTATLDDFYANWADLRANADRWSIYGMEYHRKPRTAAGTGSTDAEALFEDRDQRSSSSSSSSSASGTGSTGSSAASGDDAEGVTLYQISLRIFLVEKRDQALITLQTYLPSTLESTTVAGGSSGSSR